MPTKPIPPGTVNFATNMLVQLRLEAGRLAFLEDKSLGELIREMLTERVETARKAGRFLRQQSSAALVVAGFIALAWASVSPTATILARRVRANRGVRTVACSLATRVRCTRAAA